MSILVENVPELLKLNEENKAYVVNYSVNWVSAVSTNAIIIYNLSIYNSKV